MPTLQAKNSKTSQEGRVRTRPFAKGVKSVVIFSLFFLAYMYGKEDGKWGPFAVLIGILIIASIASKCSGN